jgi:DNA mismatch repair protein MutS2
MNEKEKLEKLEYYKILESISQFTKSEVAKELINEIKPFKYKDYALRRGELVSAAKRLLIERIYPPETFDYDIRTILEKSRIEGFFLSGKDFLKVGKLLAVSRSYVKYFSINELALELKKEFSEMLYVDQVLEKRIESIIDRNGEVRDNASPKLREIRITINEKSRQLKLEAERKLRKLSDDSVLMDEYLTLRDGRYVLPVKAEYKRQVKGFIHSESATGQTVYIEPEEILGLNNELISLSFEEKRELNRILLALTEQIAVKVRDLLLTLETLGKIEMIFAIARYSDEYDCSFPQVNDNSPLQIIDGRHPVLLQKIGKKKTVPLNLNFAENNVIIITGPNAGGKTVVLKTVALLNLLVKSGVHVSASPDSNFRFYSNILIDIGDEQSIEENLSTFSSHLSNINSILNSVDENSLVLFDELGTGTDPTEGAALASAILLELADKGVHVLATTHHGNLKLLANDTEGFQNASLEFNIENIEPTFKLNQGEPGASYAFEVAERIGLDKTLLSRAKSYVNRDNSQVEKMIIDLQKQSHSLSQKLNDAEIENTRLKGLANLYEKNLKELKSKKNKILEKAREDASLLISEANKKIESAIKEIKENQGKRDAIKKAKKEIVEFKTKIDKQSKKIDYSTKRDFKEGDWVTVRNSNSSGQIEVIDKKKNSALVVIGSLKVNVNLSELVPSKKSNSDVQKFSKIDYYSNLQSVKLDIRGKKPEEAEFEVIRFIDDAYSSNTKEVEILHGKGTGALRETVTEILKSHQFVESFHFAKIELGGEGLTIVKLK